MRQPYAWAISHGTKRVENRGGTQRTSDRATTSPASWTDYRGQLAIHAAQAVHALGPTDPRVPTLAHRPDTWQHGAVVALADLLDCHPDTGCCRPWGDSALAHALGAGPTVTVHHLVLDKVVPGSGAGRRAG